MTDWVEHLTVLHRLTGQQRFVFSHEITVMIYPHAVLGYQDGFIKCDNMDNLNQWMNSHVGIHQLA